MTDQPVGVRFQILGPLKAFGVDDMPLKLGGTNQRRLLATLLAHANSVIPAERLGEWCDLTPGGLRTAISRLRQVVGADTILSEPPGYALRTEHLDGDQFIELIDEAREAPPAKALAIFDQALALWHGDAFVDVAYESWAQAKAVRLQELRTSCIEDHAERLLLLGRWPEVVAAMEAHVVEHALRDRPRELLIRALAADGRQTEALRAFQQYRSHLGEEIGTEPGDALCEVEAKIATGWRDRVPETATAEVAETAPATTGLVTFLLTDIANNTALWEGDPAEALAALNQHDRMVLTAVTNNGGRIVQQTGDGVQAVFDEPLPAVHAALQAQLALAEAFGDSDFGLRVRMGIHAGMALARGNAYLGRTVTRSEHVLAAASGGQILCSSAVAELVVDQLPELYQLAELDERLLPRSDDLAGTHILRHPELAVASVGPGETIRGIRIGSRLSTDTLGDLWSGIRISDERKVVVRVLHQHDASDTNFSRRFELDSHLLEQLDHANAEDLIDSWQDGYGPFLVFAHHAAIPLADHIREHGLPDTQQLCAIVRSVGDVMHEAHRRRLAHGRISLDSVLIDADHTVLVTGFAVAGAGMTDLECPPPELTGSDQATSRSDIYSLAVITHQLLTGSRPMPNRPGEPVAVNESLDADTTEVLERALAARPIDRHRSITDFVDDLGEALGQSVAKNDAPNDLDPVTLPPAIDQVPATGFIGRSEELAAIAAAWQSALDGQPQRVLLQGEAGAGKSAIAAEAAQLSSADGALVLFGACLQHVRAPYQPIASAIREYLARSTAPVITNSAALDLILQPTMGRLGSPSESRQQEGSLVAQEIAGWFAAIASTQPTFFVVDDVQWADAESLAVLDQIHNWSGPHRICVVLTHRSTEADAPAKRLATSARRDPRAHVIDIGGVCLDDVGAFLRASTRDVARFTSAHDWVIAAIHDETGGNALFVSELVRHLTDTGRIAALARTWKPAERVADLGIPETVRDVVSSRIEMLSTEAQDLLPSAAVLGTNFDPRLWRTIANVEGECFVAATEELLTSGLLIEQQVDQYRFAHAIIQSTIYQQLTSLRRSHLHRKAATALETHDAQRVDDLATHFTAGAADGDANKAVAYNAAAADDASSRFAYTSAARHLAATLQLADDGLASLSMSERTDVLIALGVAQREAGNQSFRETLFEAAELASSQADDERLLQTTLANRSTLYSLVNNVDDQRLRWLNETLSLDHVMAPSDRALLLSQQALELTFAPDLTQRLGLSEQALAAARESADVDVLATVLVQRHATLDSPSTMIDRNPICDELDGLVSSITDPMLAFMSAQASWITRSQHGDAERTEAALRAMTDRAEAAHHPAPVWRALRCRATDAAMTGDLQRAERLARQSLAVGLAAGMEDLWTYFGPQMFGIRFLQGRMHEIADSAAQDATNDLPPFVAGLALLYAEIGELDRSEAMMLRLFTSDFESRTMLTHGPLTTLAAATMANARLDNKSWAERLGTMWAPYLDRCVSETPAFWGAAHHHVGLIELTLGNLEQACAHFEAAVDTHERIGSPPWAALSQLEWATACQRLGTETSERQAKQLRDQSAATAKAFSLQPILQRLNP